MLKHAALGTALWCAISLAQAAVTVLDDSGHTVSLKTPATRIVSLSPHATELLYAAGAGARLVGVSEYSNYPPPAKRIPTVGGATTLDLERIIAAKPDLVVVWRSGNQVAQIAKLRTLGIPIFDSEPRDFEAIASSMERLAHLAGTDATGNAAATSFRARLKVLRSAYGKRHTVPVFYQVWHKPLMTLNDTHMVSAAIRLCGGRNVFGALPQIAPTVDVEAVLNANPEVVITGGSQSDDTLSSWKRFPTLLAVARGNLATIDSDVLTRAGPRIIEGTEALCKHLDVARSKRR